MFHFARPDAEGQRAKRAMGRGVGITADDRHAGQRESLLRADDVDHALPDVVHAEKCDAEGGAVVLQRLICLALTGSAIARPRSVVGTLWSGTASAAGARNPSGHRESLKGLWEVTSCTKWRSMYSNVCHRVLPARHGLPKFYRTVLCTMANSLSPRRVVNEVGERRDAETNYTCHSVPRRTRAPEGCPRQVLNRGLPIRLVWRITGGQRSRDHSRWTIKRDPRALGCSTCGSAIVKVTAEWRQISFCTCRLIEYRVLPKARQA